MNAAVLRRSAALLAVVACAALASDERDQAREASDAVMDRYGSADKLDSQVMQPLSTGEDMATVDGETTFSAQVSCPASERFLRVSIAPNSSNDLQNVGVQLDSNFDGTVDFSNVFSGPIAAVCVNGFQRCTANTTNPCTYHRWAANTASVWTEAVGQEDLGSCYCFNNSCGNGLLIRNSRKIVNDLGVGMIAALQAANPRISAGEAVSEDEFSTVFYGQNSGCGAASWPEAYRNNPGGLIAAGEAANSDPDFQFAFLRDSAAAQQSGVTPRECTISRQVTTGEVWRDAVTVLSQTTSHAGVSAGTVSSCGPGCMQVIMNQRGNNYYQNLGSCGLRTFTTDFRVDRPDLITSVTINEVGRDDWLRIRVNGTTVYSDDAGWTGSTARCGENGNRGTRNPNVDVTGRFTSVAPGSTVSVVNDLSVADDGEGWSVWTIRYEQTCDATAESVNDLCAPHAGNASCQLWQEEVDGVRTIENYYSTGLSPLPSSQMYGEASCQVSLHRDWHQQRRTYMCQEGTSPYSGDDARRRYNAVHGSFDAESGAFVDERKEGEVWTSSSEQIQLPPPDPYTECVPTCKTRRPRPGAEMGTSGATTQLNATGIAWDYTYRACDRDPNVCPAEADEDVIEACGCRSTFGEAATMMQTIRMVGQDMICTQD